MAVPNPADFLRQFGMQTGLDLQNVITPAIQSVPLPQPQPQPAMIQQPVPQGPMNISPNRVTPGMDIADPAVLRGVMDMISRSMGHAAAPVAPAPQPVSPLPQTNTPLNFSGLGQVVSGGPVVQGIADKNGQDVPIPDAELNGEWQVYEYRPTGSTDTVTVVVPATWIAPPNATKVGPTFQGKEKVERAVGMGYTIYQQPDQVKNAFLTPEQDKAMRQSGGKDLPTPSLSSEEIQQNKTQVVAKNAEGDLVVPTVPDENGNPVPQMRGEAPIRQGWGRDPQTGELIPVNLDTGLPIVINPETGAKIHNPTPGYGIQPDYETGNSPIPVLTTSDLYSGNPDLGIPANPELAIELANNGILGIQYNEMVVRQSDGTLKVVPYEENTQQNVVLYGNTPVTRPKDFGDPGDIAIGAATTILDLPRRAGTWGVAEMAQHPEAMDFVLETTNKVLSTFSLPTYGVGPQGATVDQKATLDAGPINVLNDFQEWATANPTQFQYALDHGYTAEDGTYFEPGNRAAWEMFVSTKDPGERIVYDMVTDPTFWLPFFSGAARGTSSALRTGITTAEEAIPLWRTLAANYLDNAAKYADVPDVIVDKIVGPMVKLPFKVIGKSANAVTGGRLGEWAGNMISQSVRDRTIKRAGELADTIFGIEQRAPIEDVPPITPPPSAAPGPGNPPTAPITPPTAPTTAAAPVPGAGRPGALGDATGPIPPTGPTTPAVQGPTGPQVVGPTGPRVVGPTGPRGPVGPGRPELAETPQIPLIGPRPAEAPTTVSSPASILPPITEEPPASVVPTEAQGQRALPEPTYEQLSDDVRRVTYPDGRTTIEQMNSQGTWEPLVRPGEVAPRLPRPEENPLRVQGPEGQVSLADQPIAPPPAADTVLAEARGEAPIAPPPVPELPSWGFASPSVRDEEIPDQVRNIVDQAWDLGQQDHARWQRFVETHDPKAREFLAKERMRKQYLHGDERDIAEGINEAEYIINDLIPDFQATYGDVAETPRQVLKRRPDASVPAEKRSFRGQDTQQLIERAVFDERDNYARRAMDVLETRSRRNDSKTGAVVRQEMYDLATQRLPELRRQYQEALLRGSTPSASLQPQLGEDAARLLPTTRPTPAPAVQLPAGEAPIPEFRRVGLDQITTARESPDIVPDGLDFQMRNADYAEQSVQNIVGNYRPQEFDPIAVTRGADGRYVVLSGHSRLEAARRLNLPDVPIREVTGSRDEILGTALRSNTAGTALRPTERGANIRRQMEQLNNTINQVAKNEKISLTEAKQYVNTTYLPQTIQDVVDLPGGVDLRAASSMGEAIRDGVFSPSEMQVYFERRVKPGNYSTKRITEEISTIRQAKKLANIEQTGLFGNADLGNTGVMSVMDQLMAAGRERRALVTKRNSYERVAKGVSGLSKAQQQELGELNRQIQVLDSILSGGIQKIADAGAPRKTISFGVGGNWAEEAADTVAEQSPADVMRAAGASGLDLFGPQAGFISPIDPLTQKLVNQLSRLREEVPNEIPGPKIFQTGEDQIERFRNRVITEDEASVLSHTFHGTDETMGERWNRYTDEYLNGKPLPGGQQKLAVVNTPPAGALTPEEAEMKAAERVIGDYTADLLREDPKMFARYQEEYTRLTTRRNEPLDELSAQAQALHLAMMPDTRKALRAYDSVLGAIREMALYNTATGIRYIWTQAVGNSLTAILTGNTRVLFYALNPENLRAAYQEITHTPERLLIDSADKLAQDLNIAKLRNEAYAIVRDEVTDFADDAVTARPTRLYKAADKVGLGRLTTPFASRRIRDMAGAFDLSFRKGLWASRMNEEVWVAARQARREALDRAASNTKARVLPVDVNQMFDRLGNTFSSDDIRFVGRELGMDETFTDRLARDWQNTLSTINKNAREEVNRVFFSGEQTNLDNKLRRIFFFHYWMSRSFPLYTESLMKNPGWLNAYINMTEAAKEQAESGKYGPGAKGLVALFQTPMGFTLFARPDALFQVFNAFWQESPMDPDGQTLLGKFVDSSGVMFNPLITSVLNYAGVMGETFAPDPLMLNQTTQLATDAITYARGKGWLPGDGPASNDYTDLNAWLRSKTSGVLPGTENVPFSESDQYSQVIINNLIQDVAEERGIDPNSPEVLAAMSDPQSDLYQEAFGRYADQLLLDRVNKNVLPTSVVYPKSRVNRPDERRYEIGTMEDGTQKDALYQERQIANTVNAESRQLYGDRYAYKNLGDPQADQVRQTYSSIRGGYLTTPVEIGGQTYTAEQINGADDATRQQAADLWASEGTRRQQIDSQTALRKDYQEKNPEWGQYQDWANTVRDYPGGVMAWWDEVARSNGNPNAARWYRDLPADRRTEQVLLGVDAYMAYKGIQQSYMEPSPTSVRNDSQIPWGPGMDGTGNGQNQGQGYKNSDGTITVDGLYRQINDYRKKAADYKALVEKEFGAGVDPTQMNPQMQNAIYTYIGNKYGVSEPSVPATLELYRRWYFAQPEGADRSEQAFVNWYNAQITQNTTPVLATTPAP